MLRFLPHLTNTIDTLLPAARCFLFRGCWIRLTKLLIIAFLGIVAQTQVGTAQSLDTLWLRLYLADDRQAGEGVISSYVVGDSVLLAGGYGDEVTGSHAMLMWLTFDGAMIDTNVVYSNDEFVPTFAFLTDHRTIVFGGVFWADTLVWGMTEVRFDGEALWWTAVTEFPESFNHGLNQGCDLVGGGYAYIGYVNVPGPERRFWVVWTDSLGRIRDQQVIDWNDHAEPADGASIVATADSGIVVSGLSYTNISHLIKLDAAGNVMWRRWFRVGIADEPEVLSIIETMNGDLAMTGRVRSLAEDGLDLLVARCDADGNLRWVRQINHSEMQEGHQIIETVEGHLVITGVTDPNDTLRTAIIASFEATGEIREFDYYDTPYALWANTVCQLPDSTFMVAGAGFLDHGTGIYYDRCFAIKLTPDRREPVAPTAFHLWSPEDGSVIGGSSTVFAWQPSFDADPFDTVRYEVRFWTEQVVLQPIGTLDTVVSVLRTLLIPLGTEEPIQWTVFANSRYPVATTVCADTFWFELSAGVGPSGLSTPSEFELSLYPNPFNSQTRISLQLPQTSNAVIDLYNLAGQKVRTLLDKLLPAGETAITLDAADLPSGVYFVGVTTPEFRTTQKLPLLK